MSIELQIAEVNQFWISDLRFEIEESMLEAGAAVDWGVLGLGRELKLGTAKPSNLKSEIG